MHELIGVTSTRNKDGYNCVISKFMVVLFLQIILTCTSKGRAVSVMWLVFKLNHVVNKLFINNLFNDFA